MSRPKRSLAERFWEKVQKTETCWLWTGSVTKAGYGQINDGGRPWTMLAAHRVSWELNCGPIPNGLWVLHGCDNPKCVRPHPDHLFLGTHTDNMADMVSKGRAACGKNVGRGKLEDEQVFEIRRLKSSGKFNGEQLAAIFGVSPVQISRIVRNLSRKLPQ